MGKKKRKRRIPKQTGDSEKKAPGVSENALIERKPWGKSAFISVLKIVLFAIPLLLGMYYSLNLRYKDVTLWKRRYFIVNGKGPLASTDAYLWLKYARDIYEGKYRPGGPDNLRCYPDGAKYPERKPLTAVLLEKIVKLSPKFGRKLDFEEVAFWIPPVLATLAAIPIFLYGLEVGGIITAAAGATFGIISLGFFHRTTIARYDTDGLNMFFIFMFPYFFLLSYKKLKKFGEGGEKKNLYLAFLFSALAGITAYLMAWWYGHEGFPLIFWLAFVALLFFPVKTSSGKWRLDTELWKEKLLLALTFLLFYSPLNVIKGIPDPVKFLRSYLFYPKTIEAGFPQVLQSISEIQKLSPSQVFKNVGINSPFAGWVALLSFIVLMVIRFRKFVPILPLVLFSFLIFFRGARRLTMFLAPFLGMGIGAFFEFVIWGIAYLLGEPEQISRSRAKRGEKPRIIPNKWVYNFVVLSLTALLVVAFVVPKSSVKKLHAVPVFNVPTYRAFSWLSRDHRGDHILTWWDYGYAIIYLGRTATYHDGGTFNSPRTYFVAKFFTTDNFTEGINGILGMEKLGANGILDKVKEKIPEYGENATAEVVKEILSGRYNKYPDDDVIVLISEDMIPKFAWISFFGTWDFIKKNGKHLYISPLRGCFKKDNILYCDNQRVQIHLDTGEITGGARVRSISIYTLVDKINRRLIERKFESSDSDLVVEEIIAPGIHRFYLLNKRSYNSTINRMFFLDKYPQELFERIYDDFPHVVMYRLKREKLEELGFIR